MSKFGLTGKFRAHAGHVDELVAILLQAARAASTLKGCYLYLVSKDAQDQNGIWVTEVWASKEDHDKSLNLSGTRELIAQALPMIDGRPESTSLEVMGGAGIDFD